MKRLLLHICCAPDATVGLERLSDEWEIVPFFDNPNIHPRQEYERRLAAMRKLAGASGISLQEGTYDPDAWMEEVVGLEHEPEKGRRCAVCIAMRMERAARQAAAVGCDAFAAVLTVSPHKDAALVNRLGEQAATAHGVQYLPTDLKKKDGFKRSIELSRELDLYRQNYCGCRFSIRD